MYIHKRICVQLLLVLSLFVTGLTLSCKKDRSQYEVSYSEGSSSTWYSDKVEAVIANDTMLVTGKKNDGSSIAIAVSGYTVGSYPITLTGMKSLVVINQDGSKDNTTNYLSIEGNVTVTSNDEKKKEVSGTFTVKAVNKASVLQPKNITGKFTAKYTKY